MVIKIGWCNYAWSLSVDAPSLPAGRHGWFWECAQPMRGDVTILHHLPLAGRIHKMIPVGCRRLTAKDLYFIAFFSVLSAKYHSSMIHPQPCTDIISTVWHMNYVNMLVKVQKIIDINSGVFQGFIFLNTSHLLQNVLITLNKSYFITIGQKYKRISRVSISREIWW